MDGPIPGYGRLLAERRSIRDFTGQPVPTELIDAVIAESTLAPNASNEQPWKYSVVKDTSLMQRISDESKKNILARIERNPADPISKYAPVLRSASYNVFYNAPCLVIISGEKGRRNLRVDCALAAGYLTCRYIVASRLGRVAVAVRDAESRTRFIGYRVERVKLFVFTFSAMLAGVAGALYVPQVGIINPGEFSPLNSIELVIWVAIGGRATLYGAVIGAILVNYGKTYFTGVLPEAWLFALGGLFVLVTLFLPKGIAGLFALLRRTPKAGAEAAA